MPNPLYDTALLLLRAAVGVVFLMHGVDKLGDLDGTEQYFDSLGIPAAGVMAPVATFTEVVGGALLVAGLATPLAGVALAADMAVALVAQHAPNGFFVADAGYEFVLVLGVASLAIALAGPGRLSADAALRLPERVIARLPSAIAR